MLLIKTKKALIVLVLCLFTLSLLFFPSAATHGAQDGISLCLKTVIPSLYPFFVISSMCVSLGFADRIGKFSQTLMGPLFSISGTCSLPVILGLVAGSPSGVRSCVELYKCGSISKDEAEFTVGFCNNCGPAFVIGMVGGTLFFSVRLGVYFYVIHIISSMSFGLITSLFRHNKNTPCSAHPRAVTPGFARAFTDSVTNAWTSVLMVCSYVIFFSVVLSIINSFHLPDIISTYMANLLHIDGNAMLQVLTGLFEVTAGVTLAHGNSVKASLIATSFVLGWSGLSSLFQALSVMSGSGLSPKMLLVGKLFQGIFSAFLTFLTADIAISKFVPAFMATGSVGTLPYIPTLTIFPLLLLSVWVCLVAVLTKKRL